MIARVTTLDKIVDVPDLMKSKGVLPESRMLAHTDDSRDTDELAGLPVRSNPKGITSIELQRSKDARQ